MNTKTAVLALLERNRGQSLSGTAIAAQLGISRNAVWKAIKTLQKNGYEIEAVTNKGYCLSAESDILSVQGMLPFLSCGGGENGEKIRVFSSLESTNKTAKELAISDAEHGTVILANHQTAGRGRYGRSFFSPAGHGVYLSVILRPQELWLSEPTLVTAFAAVAVCEAIEAISDEKPRIKWVNDIFINEKKVCGILTEAVTSYESGAIEWIVVGIGVNFSAPQGGFPEELQGVAGAVFLSGEKKTQTQPVRNPDRLDSVFHRKVIDGRVVTRNRLAAEIINRMALLSGNTNRQADLLEKYKIRLLYLGEKITVTGAGAAPAQTSPDFEATAIDIDEIGRLIVKTDTGEIIALSSGEVSVRYLNKT